MACLQRQLYHSLAICERYGFASKPLSASSQHTWLRSSVNTCPTGCPPANACPTGCPSIAHEGYIVDLRILVPLLYNFCRIFMVLSSIWIHLDRMVYMSLKYLHSLEAQHHANDSEQLRHICTTCNKSSETALPRWCRLQTLAALFLGLQSCQNGIQRMPTYCKIDCLPKAN